MSEELPVVLYSQFTPPDVIPDVPFVGEVRPEDNVRIAESEPGVSNPNAWVPDPLTIQLLSSGV